MRHEKQRSGPAWLRASQDLLAAPFAFDSRVLEAARAAVAARTIDYPYGTGQAEEVALAAGLKPIVRQQLPAHAVDAARARFEAQGYLTRVGAGRMADTRSPGQVLHVGRDATALQESLALDTVADDTEVRHGQTVERLGHVLGYPACCVSAFVELPAPRRNLPLLARALARTTGLGAARLNMLDLAVFHYISWIPCALDCQASLRYADAVAQHLRQLHGRPLHLEPQPAQGRAPCPPDCRHVRFVDAVDAALAAPRLVLFEAVQLSLTGTWRGDELRIAQVWPTARDRHPRAGLDGQDAEVTARLLALVQQAERVAVQDHTLFLDGQPVLASAEMLLVPFAGPP